MASLNKAAILGNVGKDPEIKSTTGQRVANFSVATSEKWKDRNTGEEKERTEWHRVVVWQEGLVGVVERYVSKGTKIYLEGQIQTRKYEKDGIERYTTEIVLSGFDCKLVLCGQSGGGGISDVNENASRPGNSYCSDQSSGYGTPHQSGVPDEDIPF